MTQPRDDDPAGATSTVTPGGLGPGTPDADERESSALTDL
jgi:hypothetical protein